MTSILHDGLYAEKQAVTWEKDGAAYEIGGWYADPPTFTEMPHSWAPNDVTGRKCRSDYKIAPGAQRRFAAAWKRRHRLGDPRLQSEAPGALYSFPCLNLIHMVAYCICP